MRIGKWHVGRIEKAYGPVDLMRDLGFSSQGGELNPIKIIEEGYRTNPTVFAAARVITTASSLVPWVPQRRMAGGRPVDANPNDPAWQLLDRPNPWHSWAYLVEALVGSQVLFGESIAILNGPGNPAAESDKNIGPAPTEIVWIPKQWVRREVYGFDNQVRAYEVNTTSGTRRFLPHRVIDLCSWNPLNPWTGQGRIQAAAGSVDTSNMSRTWNRNLLKQGARPAGVLMTDATLEKSVYERLRQEVSEKLSGANGAGKPPILDGGLKWQSTGMSASDMEFQAGQRELKREITTSMGVDPSMIGDHELKTYSNYSEARIALYQDTVLPLLGAVKHALLLRLRAWYPDLDFLLDTDQVPVLAEARRQSWDTIAGFVERGILTRNEAREQMGYDDVDGGDVILVPLNLVPLSDVAVAATPGVGGAEDPYVDPNAPAQPEEGTPVSGKAKPLIVPSV